MIYYYTLYLHRSGLESQLLAFTILHEEPELERRKTELLKEEECLKQRVLKNILTSARCCRSYHRLLYIGVGVCLPLVHIYDINQKKTLLPKTLEMIEMFVLVIVQKNVVLVLFSKSLLQKIHSLESFVCFYEIMQKFWGYKSPKLGNCGF